MILLTVSRLFQDQFPMCSGSFLKPSKLTATPKPKQDRSAQKKTKLRNRGLSERPKWKLCVAGCLQKSAPFACWLQIFSYYSLPVAGVMTKPHFYYLSCSNWLGERVAGLLVFGALVCSYLCGKNVTPSFLPGNQIIGANYQWERERGWEKMYVREKEKLCCVV